MKEGAPRLVVGVEVHVQLGTRTKAFCACPVDFGAAPNTLCCPVCMGHPGALPVLNRGALETAVRAGLALGCTVAPKGRTQWDRKNYFYPDLPKGYQITQYEHPLCENGALALSDGTRVRIRRAHLEEDTGKSSHAADGATLLDFNRCGVPLLEIVTEPDLSTPAEVEEYLRLLQERLRLAGASECSMEKGQMRCEPNVNLERGDGSATAISELKNLNSFAMAREAVGYEAKRLEDGPWLPRGRALLRATFGWDDGAKRTILQRTKETAADYRYFPEPDLPVLPAEALRPFVEAGKAALEESSQREVGEEARFKAEAEKYNLQDLARAMKLLAKTVEPEDISQVFTVTAQVAEERGLNPRDFGPILANWVQGPIAAHVRARSIKASMVRAQGRSLARLLEMTLKNEIPTEVVKVHFLSTDWLEVGTDPEMMLKEKGLTGAQTDDDSIRAACAEVVAANPDIVAKIRGGKVQARAALVGQVMKKTRGTADPARVNALLDELLR